MSKAPVTPVYAFGEYDLSEERVEFHLLEGRFEVILVNAEPIKQVPGRKTDVKDCQWIAQLLQHGLLKASFVPPQPIRELRDLTRQRAQLVAEKATAANRIQKVLEDANIKLASVATDVLGVSGRDMLEAIIAGEDDAEQLADKARKRLRQKIPQLQTALRGRVTDHHRFQLRVLMDHVTHLEGLIGRLTHSLNAIRNECSISGVRVVHHPPEFNTLVRRSASLFLQREYSAHASSLFELYKARLLIFHDHAQFFGIESTSLLDVRYM